MTAGYTHANTINLPAPASAVSFGPENNVAVGSIDGSLRLYDLPSTKVAKAITKLGDEVASIAWESSSSKNLWFASGITAFHFDMEVQKMILSPSDAALSIPLGEDEEDVLNELSISPNTKSLAFASDNGSVGVMNLVTREVSRMKKQHGSICSSVKFIPDRPTELVSGGYDSGLLHFDFVQRNVLSSFDITATPAENAVSLSPPFILSTAVSSTGLIAASTADGRLWLGTGGDKSHPSNSKPGKKRTRKWEGLRAEDGLFVQVAEGPVVACAFVNDQTLVTSTLLGKLAQQSISYKPDGALQVQTTWNAEVSVVAKVNALSVNGRYLLVGGISKDRKGAVEIWSSTQNSG